MDMTVRVLPALPVKVAHLQTGDYHRCYVGVVVVCLAETTLVHPPTLVPPPTPSHPGTHSHPGTPSPRPCVNRPCVHSRHDSVPSAPLPRCNSHSLLQSF